MTDFSVSRSPTPGTWLVRMGGRVYATQLVLLIGEKVELPGARELALPPEPTPYEAALSALFPPGSRARWQDLGALRDVEVVSAPSFDVRLVRTPQGEREVRVPELRAC